MGWDGVSQTMSSATPHVWLHGSTFLECPEVRGLSDPSPIMVAAALPPAPSPSPLEASAGRRRHRAALSTTPESPGNERGDPATGLQTVDPTLSVDHIIHSDSRALTSPWREPGGCQNPTSRPSSAERSRDHGFDLPPPAAPL